MELQHQQHGTCVDVDGAGILLIGKSGSGKSGLALQLMAYGAALVADDRVELTKNDGQVVAKSAPNIQGLVEARGVGILNADTCDQSSLIAAIDMNKIEEQRLPPDRMVTFLGLSVPLLYKVDNLHFAASIWQLLRKGWNVR